MQNSTTFSFRVSVHTDQKNRLAVRAGIVCKGPSTLATLFSHRWPRFCGIDIYSRKPLFSSFGEHTAVCGSSVRQAVARPRHRRSVCIHNIHVAATCRPSVLGSATKTRPPVAKQSGQCARALNRSQPNCSQLTKNLSLIFWKRSLEVCTPELPPSSSNCKKKKTYLMK